MLVVTTLVYSTFSYLWMFEQPGIFHHSKRVWQVWWIRLCVFLGRTILPYCFNLQNKGALFQRMSKVYSDWWCLHATFIFVPTSQFSGSFNNKVEIIWHNTILKRPRRFFWLLVQVLPIPWLSCWCDAAGLLPISISSTSCFQNRWSMGHFLHNEKRRQRTFYL